MMRGKKGCGCSLARVALSMYLMLCRKLEGQIGEEIASIWRARLFCLEVEGPSLGMRIEQVAIACFIFRVCSGCRENLCRCTVVGLIVS